MVLHKHLWFWRRSIDRRNLANYETSSKVATRRQ
jgi:hypothetical protein